jgi:hypothetical protein
MTSHGGTITVPMPVIYLIGRKLAGVMNGRTLEQNHK